MTAAEIAAALGGTHRCGGWWRCRCPVHGSRGATLAIRDGERGLIAKCFAGCDWRKVLAALRQRGIIGSDGARNGTQRHFAVRRTDAAGRIATARRIWDRACEASGTPLAIYLAGRGITIPVPPSLRWTPSLRRQDGSAGPAIVAIVEHVEHGAVGIHRTWLAHECMAPDSRVVSGQCASEFPGFFGRADCAVCDGPAPHWRRLDRATLGPIGGGAVRLAPAGELLMVGEGIETCLAAMQATGLPAWAALSTSGLVALKLPPLPLAATVVILADNDANGAGGYAARKAAGRWSAEGRCVRIAIPPEPGTDFNDVLMGRSRAAIAEPGHAA